MAVYFSDEWLYQNGFTKMALHLPKWLYFSVLLLDKCILLVYNMKDAFRSVNYLFINVFASFFSLFHLEL